MWGWNTPTLFPGTPPPLSLFQKACGPKFHEKHPGFGSSNRIGKPCCPVRRIAVNRDPFRKLRFREALELRSSRHIDSSTFPAVDGWLSTPLLPQQV